MTSLQQVPIKSVPSKLGRLSAVRGPVVEVEFAETNLPAIYESLLLDADGREVVLEVSHHISLTGARRLY